MTSIVALAERLHRRIDWNSVPVDLHGEDLCHFISDAIIDLFVKTGRSEQFNEDNDFILSGDENTYIAITQDLPLDEKEYVIVSAEIAFYTKAESEVAQLTSYSTDAMTVTHGDKPFANLHQILMDLENERLRIWYKMPRYHMLNL